MMLSVERIVIPRGRRPLDNDKVKSLAANMLEIGLKTPISVRKVRDEDGTHWHLVTGKHRLASAKRNGWDKIECREEEGSEIDAQLWEIAENLYRAELTGPQRADDTKRYVELIAGREAERKNTAPAAKIRSSKTAKKHRENEGKARVRNAAIKKAAEHLGVHEETVRQDLRISKMTPAARDAAEAAGIEKRKELAAIGSAPPAQQVAKVKEIVQGKDGIGSNRIAEAWSHASKQRRKEFVAYCRETIDSIIAELDLGM